MTDSLRQLRRVYTPAQVAADTMDLVDKRMAQRSARLTTGVQILDHFMRPVMPGEIIFVLAYTSHGKTAFMQSWAREVVGQLQEHEDQNEIVVYITWETLVEELGLYDLCGMTGVDSTTAWYGDATEAEVQKLRIAAMKRAGMPLWVLGDSLKRRRDGGPLTMKTVSESLLVLEKEYQVKPAIIFIDFLQRIPAANDRDDPRVQTIKNTDALQQLSRDCAAPVVIGCQAGRQVLSRDFKVPELGDALESSRIEQDADKVLALWYPIKTENEGTTISELGEPAVTVDPNLMICGIRKQRHAASGQVFPLHFDPARNTFTTWRQGIDMEEYR